MENTKIKVVWLCHFTNIAIQDIIKPSKRINEFAPWIPPYLDLVKAINNIELHVVSPHEYIRGTKYFVNEGVHYYFYNAHMPIIGRHWPGFFKWDYISNFWSNKRIVKKLVKKINPDLIHLHGAENAYFTSTSLQFFDKYPIIFTLQGFISLASEVRSSQTKKRILIEKQILSKITHAFYATQTMKQQLLSYNSDLKLFWNDYPMGKIDSFETPKRFDIVFFARITRDKGIGDLIKALAILKQKKEDITLCVIGGGKLDEWKNLAKENNVYDNIFWAGFLPTQNDVHLMASEAKICVLPTYHDMIPGTIIESMFLKVPVVAYDVGSIHEINNSAEIISLVKKGNIEDLANSILQFLNNPDLCSIRAEKGFNRANEMYMNNNDTIKAECLNAYKSAIEDLQRNQIFIN